MLTAIAGRGALVRLARHASRLPAVGTRQLLDLLFPPSCTSCHQDIDLPPDEILLCPQCRAAFQPEAINYCLRCGAILPDQPATSDGCELCPAERPAYDAVVTLGPYRGPLQEAVLRMKVPAGEPLCRAVCRLYMKHRREELAKFAIDCVVPVPMHWRRWIARGTNCPEVLAAELARLLRAPAIAELLVRRRHTQVQRTLKPQDRWRNVRGAFAVRKGYDLRGTRVLLVDDVLTTGATCNEAARVLKRAGSAIVVVAALAKGGGREFLPQTM